MSEYISVVILRQRIKKNDLKGHTLLMEPHKGVTLLHTVLSY